MSMFSLTIDGTDTGPFTEPELVAWLEGYRAKHPADHEFRHDASGLSPWWSCPDEKIDRLFVVLPQSRQTARFDQLSQMRWLYRLALGQPHQQDFIEAVSQLPDDGRQKFALSLSAWPRRGIESEAGP